MTLTWQVYCLGFRSLSGCPKSDGDHIIRLESDRIRYTCGVSITL